LQLRSQFLSFLPCPLESSADFVTATRIHRADAVARQGSTGEAHLFQFLGELIFFFSKARMMLVSLAMRGILSTQMTHSQAKGELPQVGKVE
jgi:hypothetical protein